MIANRPIPSIFKPMNAFTKKKHPVILIVDDEPANLEVLGNNLRSHNYDVIFALDGDEALEVTRELVPDIILLDVLMPGKGGYEVCQMLKSDPRTKEVPIIFLTVKNMPEDIVEGFRIGGVDYVTKPFNEAELMMRVENQMKLLTTQRSQAELMASQKKFFSILAHDLRDQLSACLGLQQLILSGEDEVNNPMHGDTLQSMLQQTYEFLQSMLTWGKVQMDQAVFNPEEVQLTALVHNTIIKEQARARQKQIEIENQVPDSVLVLADTKFLEVILRNLLTNAVKFTHKGGRIIVTARTIDDTIQVCVEDNGVGMTAKEQEGLFLIDEKVQRMGTNRESGSGFGLNLCHSLVELHHGRIWVESEKDQGSRFFFTLPVAELPQD